MNTLAPFSIAPTASDSPADPSASISSMSSSRVNAPSCSIPPARRVSLVMTAAARPARRARAASLAVLMVFPAPGGADENQPAQCRGVGNRGEIELGVEGTGQRHQCAGFGERARRRRQAVA